MDNDRDLLPWILGGVLFAAMAIAIAVGSTDRIASANSHPVGQDTLRASATTMVTPASAPAPMPHASAPPGAPAPQVQAVNLPPAVPAGAIWECRINGQRAFSSSPCGGKSSVRQIGPVNRMDSVPIFQQTRSYEPESSYQPPEPYPYPYPSEPQDANPGEFADNSYPVFLGFPLREHRRPDHTHRPHGQRPRFDTGAAGPPSSVPHAPKTR
jgi:hypothetical protein